MQSLFARVRFAAASAALCAVALCSTADTARAQLWYASPFAAPLPVPGITFLSPVAFPLPTGGGTGLTGTQLPDGTYQVADFADERLDVVSLKSLGKNGKLGRLFVDLGLLPTPEIAAPIQKETWFWKAKREKRYLRRDRVTGRFLGYAVVLPVEGTSGVTFQVVVQNTKGKSEGFWELRL